MFHIFGCPMHYGVSTHGLEHSLDYLRSRYDNLNMVKLPEITMPEDPSCHLKNLNSVAATCQLIAEYTYSVFETGQTPVFVAGDHSVVMGSASAASAYYKKTADEEIGMIYIDAHADINTDETTVTGNIHGLPVASLLGLGTKKLTQFLSEDVKLKPENLVFFGLRDIDPPELEILESLHIKYYTYDEICERGLDVCLQETKEYLSAVKHVHISFDIDCVNPELLPGVSVPVEGGFTLEEIFHTFSYLQEHIHICSYDIVEFNRDFDCEDKTADFTSDLVKLITTK